MLELTIHHVHHFEVTLSPCCVTGSFVVSFPQVERGQVETCGRCVEHYDGLFIAGKLQVQVLLSDTDHITSPALSTASLSFCKTSQRHMYILQNTTPGLHIACKLHLQVLLSDTDHIMSPALSSSAFPSLSEASQRQMPAGTSSSNGPEQQHTLRPYWEYLSFLFKRQPEPDPDQMLELSYRDYLQVFTMQSCRGE